MQMTDALVLDSPRRTADGYLVTRAKAARAGVYDYLASEVGAPDTFKATDVVKVYRSEAEVFAKDSVQSFINRPITNDHPREGVNAANWRDHARGNIAGAMRDGEYLAFDLVLMDADAIAAVDSGKRELSNGYSCQLDWTPGIAPDGTAFDAVQRAIRGNHVALVDKGRAGPECAIKDGDKFAACDAVVFTTKEDRVSKTITIDGLPVNLGDIAAVEAVLAKKDQAIADASAALSTEQGKVAALTAQLADAKAANDPASIDKRVADRAKLIADAKKLLPTVATDAVDEAGIRRSVVAGKLGNAADGMDDNQIAGAFVALLSGCDDAADSKPANVVSLTPASSIADAASVRDTIRANRYA